ncbi:cyclin-D4-1-like [Rhododendron vialii]|uniref:cyclin-D4-1-like n=1 Tax=Rhododendron vialii TaxID=182163 RepID=UPI00265DC465|nr:cyclin-D4-1-like [Rhododendron vialii]
MSVSPDHIALNLYCGESASEVVSSDIRINCHCILRAALDFPINEENYIAHMFDSENDQMQGHEFLRGLLDSDEVVTARCNAINWMLKVHAYHNLRQETAYLSVNYLDCFICSRTLPEGKRWQWQLLSVACLSLAAKLMEETRVPLADLQVLEQPEFMFKPKTVQRMELLVMANLTWRLRIVTPFDFVDYFIRKVQRPDAHVDQLCCVSAAVSDLILRTCQVIDFQDHRPSAIAAAAVLCAIGRNSSDPNIVIVHERVSEDAVKRCHLLFEEILTIKCDKIYDTQKYLLRTPSQTETELPTKQ